MNEETTREEQETPNKPVNELDAKVDEVVRYHAPRDLQVENITKVREATAALIKAIVRNAPDVPDRRVAIRKAREAMMTANAAIMVPYVEL